MSISNNITQGTLWTIAGFLIITLVLGLYVGRGIKNIKDYTLGNNKFNTFTLTLTYLATYIGAGSVVGVPNEIYSIGIIISLACFGWGIQNVILSFISIKMPTFKNVLTLGDIMNNYFGLKVKILTGILSFFHCICMTSLQLVMIGKITEAIIGLKSAYAIIICSIILGLYSTFGGIKSVAITDVLQFLILIIVIPIIAIKALKQIGGYRELFLKVPASKFLIFNNQKFYYYLSCFFAWSIFPHMLTSPPIIQRMLMASNKTQLKNKFLIAAIFDPIFRIAITIIGLSAIVLYPKINSNLVMIETISNLFSNGILRGLAISGIYAVIMSSIDSFMHTGGVICAHDILKPLFYKKNKFFDELKIAKISTVLVALGAIYLSINANNFLSFRNLSMWAIKSTVPILLFPLLFSLLGMKSDNKSFIFGSSFGIILFLIINYLFPPKMKMLALPLGTLSNGLAYLISHIILNKKIAIIRSEKNL